MTLPVYLTLFNSGFDGDFGHSYNKVFISPSFWLLSILIVVATLVPDFFLMSMKAFGCKFSSIFPGPQDISKKIKSSMGQERDENGVITTTL